MSALLLDTHVWIWYASGSDKLPKTAHKAITQAVHQGQLNIAAISLWELSMLVVKKRISIEMPSIEWINRSLEMAQINILPLTPTIALESCQLPGSFHEDPADRLIVATARVEKLTLFTSDSKILHYGQQKHVSCRKA